METVHTDIMWILAIYFLPTMAVLANSNYKNKGRIIFFNVIAGWTVIAWFILLFLAMGKD